MQIQKSTDRFSFRKLSLQWRLTLIITLLVTATCFLMYFFISRSAVTGIENLENYMIQIDPESVSGSGSTPITFNVDPSALFPDLSIQVQNTKDLFRTRSIIITIIIILSSSICTYFISRQALAPLRKLSAKIDQIQAQNLSETLEVPDTHDEISRLTVAFNNMLSRLDEAFTAQKQFSANAAHELRTPLAVMQTNLEVFARKASPSPEEYRSLFSMIQEQTGRLSHLASILLDMTGIQTVERSDSISLAALTDEVFCDLASVAEDKQIQLVQEDGDCMVTGSYLLLYRAVYNLVENAIKYNKSDGCVTVSIRKGKPITQMQHKIHPSICANADAISSDITLPSHSGFLHTPKSFAIIEVTDTGIGISPENQEKIFSPFFRVDKSRSRAMGGAGLGLALVSEIARQHNGEVKVLQSSEKGTTMALVLPLN